MGSLLSWRAWAAVTAEHVAAGTAADDEAAAASTGSDRIKVDIILPLLAKRG
jgi:hypothetical protein